MPKAEWIQTQDFVETLFQVSLKNTSTRSSVESTEIEIIELREAGMVLKLPKRVAASGHIVMLRILRKKAPQSHSSVQPLEITVTAKISTIEEHGANSNIATVQFYQYNENIWLALLKECSDRQNKASELIKKIQE
ncbi:MAG: hypothetical protein A2X94_04165 [Bdellovibrionales bacterium GWB1_55_8]|nr:MAG: hypothetical protein A2X94_04165 [Bdellovibrionales bacterium GWB1_55_8]